MGKSYIQYPINKIAVIYTRSCNVNYYSNYLKHPAHRAYINTYVVTSYYMDSPGFFRLPGFGRSSTSPELSPKDKRHLLQVEKALASFEALEEWADYIAFLSRLHKALQLNETTSWIPLADDVSRKLALCLLPKLPNGVHQKTLGLYDSIFRALSAPALNAQIQVWLPGLLPVISYGSMQVKPQLIALYHFLLENLVPETLKAITRPFLLSLLAGLHDNAEVFAEVMSLLDAFKQKLADNLHFWQSLFLCIITSPEKRMGALNWCTARLPSFTPFQDGEELKYSVEAQACLKEPGLLIRAFATAIETVSSFNQATDIIVVRGFFDLLVTHLPLGSQVVNTVVSPSDKQLLLMASCRVTLKRDMSLNRRLWGWLLGPENEEKDESAKYFELNALPCLVAGLLQLVDGLAKEKVQAFRISLALIQDRWEISQLVTPRVFTPILDACYANRNEPNAEIMAGAKAFFDGVEACYIWDYITCTLIADGSERSLDMLAFLLKSFNFQDEELALHIPLAILFLLVTCKGSTHAISTLEQLLDLSQPRSFAKLEKIDLSTHTPDKIISSVKQYYKSLLLDESVALPIDGPVLSLLILDYLKNWYVENIVSELSEELSSTLCGFLFTIPNPDNIPPFQDNALVESVLDFKTFSWYQEEQASQSNMKAVFGFVKFGRYLTRTATSTERSKILKIILSNLWFALVSPYPANNQVEAVRHIFELERCFDVRHIEAGILDMLMHTPEGMKVRAFHKLWTHSTGFSDAETILADPLHVILDDLSIADLENSLAVQRFVHSVVTDGSGSRLLKLITDPLLTFNFMQKSKVEVNTHDDLKLFGYYLETVLNVVKSNEKLLKELLTHEFVVSESSEKFELIKSNGWDISTYKSLVLAIVEKFLKLKLSSEALKQKDLLSNFLYCTKSALDLLSILITGSETDFESHFRNLIKTCTYYITDLESKPYEIELVEATYIKCIMNFLNVAKTMNISLTFIHNDLTTKDSLLVGFIVRGIEKCLSSILLEKWFSLLTTSLYLFNESVFNVILTLNDTVIGKIRNYLAYVKEFQKADEITDLDYALSILLSGLEDLLSISHSYLLTSNLKFSAKSQAANGDSGFLGNVILGVFQIESPSVRTEEQNKIYSILISFQDAARVAFEIWNWADSKPQIADGYAFASGKSSTYLANRLKFRSRKLLERLMDLERREVIETIIEAPCETATKVKVLHVLDSGRSQVTIPHILNSIVSRCQPQILEEKDKSSMNSLATGKQLSEFLVPYYESIDYDTVDEIWEKTILFFKQVLSSPSYYKSLLEAYLKVMHVLSEKILSKKLYDQRRNTKELADLFLKMLNAASNNRIDATAEVDQSTDPEGAVEDGLIETLCSLVESFSEIIQDSEKTNTAITSIVSSVIAPHLKSKSKSVPLNILSLIEATGKALPNRAWRTLILDVFMDNGFFTSDRCQQAGWKVAVGIWISNEKERVSELIARVTPSVQSTAANIFIWNENSEVEDRIFILRRITYLLMVQPRDLYANLLDSLFIRVGAALNSSCPALYKSAAFNLFRAISLKFDEIHLLPYWAVITQNLVEVFEDALLKSAKEFNSLPKDQLQLVLCACKLLDQLLIIGFDEFKLGEWLFVASDPASMSGLKLSDLSLIDRLAIQTESLMIKEDPISVSHPTGNEKSKPVLCGVTGLLHIANLRRFFGSFSYINYERTYGLYLPNLAACEQDTFADLAV